jgi:hypothetical protein
VLGRDFFAIPEAIFEGLEQETPPVEAIDDLKSDLIAAYERALQKGVSPFCAIGSLLDLVAEETQRCPADTGS